MDRPDIEAKLEKFQKARKRSLPASTLEILAEFIKWQEDEKWADYYANWDPR